MKLLVAAAALAPFLGALVLPFNYDGITLVRDNPGFADWHNLRHLLSPQYYGVFGVGNWHPLPLGLAFGLRQLAGPAAWPFHLVSLAVHTLNALLALRLGRRLFDPRVAAAGALLWAASPLHAQAVFIAAFLPDLLCAAFSLLTLIAFFDSPRAKAPAPRVWALFALALLCKETAAALPLVAWALGGAPRGGRELARRFAPFAGVLLVYTAARVVFLADLRMLAASPGTLSEPAWAPTLRLLQAWSLSLWPHPLMLMRDNPGLAALQDPRLQFSVLAAAACAFALGRARAGLAGLYGLAWFFLWMLPFLNVLPVGYARDYFIGRWLGERYLYLASLGALWTLTGAIEGFLADARARRRGAAAAGAAAAVFAALAWNEWRHYRTPVALWTRVVERNPKSFWGWNSLGVAELERDDAQAAMRAFREAAGLRVRGDFERATLWSNVGAAYFKLGEIEKSRAAYRQARDLERR